MQIRSFSGFHLGIGLLMLLPLLMSTAARAEGEAYYDARTTLLFLPNKDSALDVDRQLTNVLKVATSSTVIMRSVSTLTELGIKEPVALISHLTILPAQQGTTMLQITVTSDDACSAKTAADVVAKEVRRFLSDLTGEPSMVKLRVIEKHLRLAKERFADAVLARKRPKHGNLIPLLDADLRAAQQSYVWFQRKLNEARLTVDLQQYSSSLVVVDPAYVTQQQIRAAAEP